MIDAVTRAFPHAVGPEKSILSSMLQCPAEFLVRAAEEGCNPDWFYQPANRSIFENIARIHGDGEQVELVSFCQKLIDRGELDRCGGPATITDIYNHAVTHSHFIPHLNLVREKYTQRCILNLCATTAEAVYDSPEETGRILESHETGIRALSEGIGPVQSIARKLEDRRFDSAQQLPRPRSLMELSGVTIFTPGNLGSFQGPPKQGKTAAIIGAIAATLNGNRVGADTLGFTAENPDGFALIHFDTEQSPYDHDQLVRRALTRARLETPPAWFYSYCLTDLAIPERLRALNLALEKGKEECGGVYIAIIDGVADLCLDPNDSAEAFALVGSLHAKAITYDCAIVTVIHENPGSEIGKTRGHLGSHIERKAESNLRVAKDADGISTIFSQRNRHGDIPKESGPRFCWSDEKHMHVSCDSARNEKASAIREAMLEEAEDSFDGATELTYTVLVEKIQSACDLKIRSAKGRVEKWAAEGIIRKTQSGGYSIQ